MNTIRSILNELDEILELEIRRKKFLGKRKLKKRKDIKTPNELPREEPRQPTDSGFDSRVIPTALGAL